MLLLRSWKESLLLFVPKNMKLFMLVTIKSAIELYGLLMRYFWWLLVLAFVFDFGCYYQTCMLKGIVWSAFDIMLKWLLFYTLCMLARPSLMPKDSAYINAQLYKSSIGFLTMYALFGTLYLMNEKLLIHRDAPSIVGLVILFAALFYLDSSGSMKDLVLSFYRGMKMLVYNLPFAFLSSIVFLIFYQLLLMMFGIYGRYLFFSFIPFVVSYFKNMYVKRLHDQFNLYYVV